MPRKRQIEILQLFNEKVEKLLGSSLTPELKKQFGGIIEWKRGESMKHVFVGPEGEPIDSFILTLRFFIQHNEATSLERMRDLYSKLNCPRQEAEFKALCDQLNNFLDRNTNMSIEQGRSLTYRDTFEIFVWGSLAHSNKEKRKIFEAISQTAMFPIFQTDFTKTLRGFLMVLGRMKEVNERALSILRS